MQKYIVYKTTCLINNKIYIGVHKTENPDIFDGYLGRGFIIGDNKYLKNPIAPLHYAIRKYGYENFNRETLFIYEDEDSAYTKEAEIVDFDFIQRDDTYNVALGGKGRPRPAKKVYKFDLEGNLIEEFESALSAAKSIKTRVTSIYNAIRDNGSLFNALWSYKNTIDISQFNFRTSNHYYLYDSDGYFCNDFETAKECIEFLNTGNANLSRAVMSKIKINGFFISTEYYEKLQIVVTKLSGKLNRYTPDGKYIDSFNTINEAKQKLGLKLSSISQAIKLNRICNGFRWTRTDNPSDIIDVPEIKNKKRKVVMKDESGEIIKVFESTAEAERQYPGCGNALKSPNRKSHGYKFEYLT